MKILAIIPARGGSKRIPKKNIKEFCGAPIISYSIKAALNSHLFDTVMVSTDDESIAKTAMEFGAKVPFMRSEKNANDYATTFDVIEEVLLNYQKDGILFDFACCIYPTAPFVNESKLKEAFNTLKDKKFDCVYPVMRFSFPVQRAVTVNNQKMQMLQPQYLNTRSQDLEPIYHDAGQFYFFKTDALLAQKKLWTDNTGVIEITELEGQDIDNEIDWQLAELKYNLLNKLS
jgi:N-acylneuraminate cytidylyltransferase